MEETPGGGSGIGDSQVSPSQSHDLLGLPRPRALKTEDGDDEQQDRFALSFPDRS